MIRLSATLDAWGSPAFADTLKHELRRLGAARLPLQQGLAHSSYALDEIDEVMLLGASETPELIRVKVGVFYAGMVAGCNCADDPSPVEAQAEYCELQLDIDKASAAVDIELLD